MPKRNLVLAVAGVLEILTTAAWGQTPAAPGQVTFERNCGSCHGGDGLGGEMGPNIAFRLTRLQYVAIAAGANIFAFGVVE